MMTSHLKMEVEPTHDMLCISNILQTMDGVQHNIHIKYTEPCMDMKFLKGHVQLS